MDPEEREKEKKLQQRSASEDEAGSSRKKRKLHEGKLFGIRSVQRLVCCLQSYNDQGGATLLT